MKDAAAFIPARLAAFIEASEYAGAAARADPSSPLLALHAALACCHAINNGGGIAECERLQKASGGEAVEESMEVAVKINRLHNRMQFLLLDIRRLIAPPRKTDGGDDAVGGEKKKKNKKKGEAEAEAGGGKEVAAPSAGSAGGEGGGGGSAEAGLLTSADGATAEPQPSDPLDEARERRFKWGVGGRPLLHPEGLMRECMGGGARGGGERGRSCPPQRVYLRRTAVQGARGYRVACRMPEPEAFSLLCAPSPLLPRSSFPVCPFTPFLRPLLFLSSLCSRLPAPRPALAQWIDEERKFVTAHKSFFSKSEKAGELWSPTWERKKSKAARLALLWELSLDM